jgi:hypothetical protein
MEQKVVITKEERTINDWLDKGWQIVSVTAQFVSIATSYSSFKEQGGFCFVLKREK